ncbi:MAG: glycosyltransferase [Gemmataceae bacterium]
MHLVIVLPVYNDWAAADALLAQIDSALVRAQLSARVLLVDDGSVQAPPPGFASASFRALNGVKLLTLRRNVGHQRAIVLGLAYQHARGNYDAVLVMDSDGEDRADDVPRLVEAFEAANREKIIFAERRRRTESLVFRAFYWLYRQMHLVLTGLRVRVGNFSILPAAAVESLMAVPETWNHVAAAVFKSRLRYDTIPTTRGFRIAGRSSMNFVALVVHGLSALSVFGEIVGVRLMVASTALFLTVGGTAAAVLGWSLGTNRPIPAWAAVGGGLAVVLLTQLVVVSFLAALSILSARNAQNFLPLRDWKFFVRRARRLPHSEQLRNAA